MTARISAPPSINIPHNHCPICGKGRNQHTNHRACSLKLQQQKAAYNATRQRATP
jgi:predicted nucleic acid-binding Zn ribbon protein